MGKSLFEGDVGSGKSTILMAIEFAFFGLGSERGASLLRSGESEGEVNLIFEVEGKVFSVKRNLIRKRNSVQQIAGKIKSEKGIFDLAPSELKEKILEILGFNEPLDPKAQSVIYRYAIFTPQEEMKTILFLRADLRLQTLRKAFRIEDYKVAVENAEELSKIVKEKDNEYNILSTDLSDLENRKNELLAKIEFEKNELSDLDKSADKAENNLKILTNKKENLRKTELKLGRVEKEIEYFNEIIHDKEKDLQAREREIDELGEKVSDIVEKIELYRKIKDVKGKTEEDLKEEILSIEQRERELRRIESQIEGKISDFVSVKDSKTCPTCDQLVDPLEFEGKIQNKKSELKTISSKVKTCEKSLKRLRQKLDDKKNFDDAKVRLNEYQELLKTYSKDVNRKNNEIGEIYSIVRGTEKKMEEAEVNLRDLEAIFSKLKEINSELEDLTEHFSRLRERIVTKRTIIHQLKKEVKEKKMQIIHKSGLKEKSQILNEYYIWIQEYFISSLKNIEKIVMVNINREFNANFQKWYSLLVEDPGKDARIDENFTPIVEQDGYDQNIYYLSGGEKTSVALAYRLALNSIVQKVSTGMKSNLLILDEPTDGFSKEQLGKVREILDELESRQIIIVSHEKELESFADQIFRVSKIQGISKITPS
jgi:exonuclease SbcC